MKIPEKKKQIQSDHINEKKGKLYLFTSYTPGAGKSYLMISKAMEEKAKARKVAIGYLNGSHRDIKKMLDDNGLDLSEKKRYSLERLIAENPDLVIMDELGARGKNKRFVYEDVEVFLNAGIDVYTTANLKKFDSANPLFKQVTGIGIRRSIPDRFLEMAECIYFVDREPEWMMKDFRDGKLFGEKYMKSKIMQKNFQKETLINYRNISKNYLKKYADKVKIVIR